MTEKTKKKLTKRQEEVLAFIKSFMKSKEYAPSQAEIADHFGFLQNAAADHLKAISRAGHIKIIPRISRGIIIK